jgi:hypothetical protein
MTSLAMKDPTASAVLRQWLGRNAHRLPPPRGSSMHISHSYSSSTAAAGTSCPCARIPEASVDFYIRAGYPVEPLLAESLAARRDTALRALAIERDGAVNPRKDLRRWDQYRAVYGYFQPDMFTPISTLDSTDLSHLDPAVVKTFAADLASRYRPDDDRDAWFAQIRDTEYPRSIREAAQIV